MCSLRNIHVHVAMRDYQESVSNGQTDRHRDRQTDARQSDPYVPLSFLGDTTIVIQDFIKVSSHKSHTSGSLLERR